MPLVVRTTGVEEFLDAAGEPNIKALIMGEPSAGKTRSASFWPQPFLADCEDGRMSLADRSTPFVRVTSSRDMDAVLTMLEFECRTKKPPQRPYKTLIIDTLDAYQRTVIQEILAGREAMAGWEDWGALNNKMTAFVARLNKLPMNIVVNLHIKSSRDGKDGPLVKEPRLAGDLRDAITAEFDLVGWMHTQWEAEGGERVLKRVIKWFPEPAFPTLKDRSGQLPQMTRVNFDDDDYGVLFERIYGDAFDALKPGQDLQEIPMEEPTQPVPPHPGGPVAPKAKPAGPAKRTEPAPAPVAEPASQPQEPLQQPEPAKADAKPKAKRASSAAAPKEPSTLGAGRGTSTIPGDPVVTYVSEVDRAKTVIADQLGGRVVTSPAPAEASDEGRLVCGTGLPGASTPPVQGCGKDLAGEDRDLVNISLIKTKTNLCSDCFMQWKRQHGK